MRVRKDGSRFFAGVTFTALHDPAGNLRGFSEFSHDLSERSASEAKYRGLLEAAPDAMVVVDQDGQIVFLLGWLLPHGVVEIPAIMVGAQAGFVLARALVGYGQPEPLAVRMRVAAPDVATLAAGLALMLVWAGIIEAFVSQLHEPVIPYWSKIAFGCVEFIVLVVFAAFAGREPSDPEKAPL